MLKKLSKFGLSGLLATGVSYVSFPLIYGQIFHGKYFVLSYVISSIINVTISFLGQKYFVFQSQGKIWLEFLKFLFGALLLILIGFSLLYFLVEVIGVESFWANFIVVTMSAISSYFFHSKITFINKGRFYGAN